MRRALPHGWTDLLRQFVLFCGAYWLYRVVRGLVDGRTTEAFEHARSVIHVEHALHVFVEPSVQTWAQATGFVEDVASWLYLNSHFTVTTLTLAWIYLFRNEHFYWVRNMFMVAMAIALVGYVVFPTAPPRLMPEWGFVDSVSDFTGVNTDTSGVSALVNPFAAVPSMHVCFALMLGLSMLRMARRKWAEVVWGLYPAMVAFVVVATANHWVLDAVAGALVAGVSAIAAQLCFARARPAAWSWDQAPVAAPAPAT